MMIVSSPSFLQLMHTIYYKIVKQLQSFKIITVALTCFGLHKPSSGNSQSVLCKCYNVDISYIYHYLELSVLCLHILFSPVMRVDPALCRLSFSLHSARLGDTAGSLFSSVAEHWSCKPGVVSSNLTGGRKFFECVGLHKRLFWKKIYCLRIRKV